MIRAWYVATTVATMILVVLVLVAVAVLTRPHAGHRGPVHWEVATILLFVALACDLIASIGYFTAKALERGGSS